MKIINRLIHNLWITYSQYQHLVCGQGFAVPVFCGFSEDSFLRKGLTNPHEFYIIEKMFN